MRAVSVARGGGGAEPRAALIPGKRVERKLGARPRGSWESAAASLNARGAAGWRAKGEEFVDVLLPAGNVAEHRIQLWWPLKVLQSQMIPSVHNKRPTWRPSAHNTTTNTCKTAGSRRLQPKSDV